MCSRFVCFLSFAVCGLIFVDSGGTTTVRVVGVGAVVAVVSCSIIATCKSQA